MLDRDRFPVDPWRLVERAYSAHDAGHTETLFSIGNGYLGLRGNHPEGWRAHEDGTFVNALHETWPIRHAEQAYGFAEVGQTIVNAPDAKTMRVFVDDEPLDLDIVDLRRYERVLDMRAGVLTRRVDWMTSAGKRVLVDSERLVSFDHRHLAVLRVRVTVPDDDATVSIVCQLANRQDDDVAPTGQGGTLARTSTTFDPRKAERVSDRTLVPEVHRQADNRAALGFRVASSAMRVAVVADHIVTTSDVHDSRAQVDPDLAVNVFRVHARAGSPVTVTKFVAYHASDDTPTIDLIARAGQTIDHAKGIGYQGVARAQRVWMDGFWARSDVGIAGHDDLQQAARWCLLQLAQATARADGKGVPAKGLTGSGYSGHYFWDTEIYVLPFLTYTTPRWALNALRMRSLMLPAARRRASQLNEAGALFPWRTINGEEASAYYAAGTAQYHINADITFALAKYVRATGDDEFLRREGIDIVVETARLWATLGFWRDGADGRSFHIHGVTGPDEYTTVVNDNLFTNVMARFNLRYAVGSIARMRVDDPGAYRRMVSRLSLDPSEPGEWEAAADAMRIPFNSTLGIHPQDALFLDREIWDLENTPADKRPLLLHFHPLVIYRYQVLKQADVVLALFLQGDQFTAEQKRADFDYYDPLTTGDSTLSAVVQSILAAEIGEPELAIDYFRRALFVDLADLHHNTVDGVHVASAGGVWTALVSGFGGMRDHQGELSFDPRLPVDWPELTFPLQWRGTSLFLIVRPGELVVRARDGEPVDFSVRGQRYTVTTDQQVVVPLAEHMPVRPPRALLPALEIGPVPGDLDEAAPPIHDTLRYGEVVA